MTRRPRWLRLRAGLSARSNFLCTSLICVSRTGRPASSYPAAMPLPACASLPFWTGGRYSSSSAGWNSCCAAIRPGSTPGWISQLVTVAAGRLKSWPVTQPRPRNRSRSRSSNWQRRQVVNQQAIRNATTSAHGWLEKGGLNWYGCWHAVKRSVTVCWSGFIVTTLLFTPLASAASPLCFCC